MIIIVDVFALDHVRIYYLNTTVGSVHIIFPHRLVMPENISDSLLVSQRHHGSVQRGNTLLTKLSVEHNGRSTVNRAWVGVVKLIHRSGLVAAGRVVEDRESFFNGTMECSLYLKERGTIHWTQESQSL